jgi:hypothetical protein
MSLRARVALLAVAAAVGCGARSSLDVPVDGAGGAPLVCPALDACGLGTPDCQSCVAEHLTTCAQITDCDPGAGGCAGNLPELHACRVWAAETVACLIQCSDDACRTAYFDSPRGPVWPLGLAFNIYDCAVCNPCADVCSGTPNFDVICNPK